VDDNVLLRVGFCPYIDVERVIEFVIRQLQGKLKKMTIEIQTNGQNGETMA
jgi:hypothetical protein